MLRFNRTVTLIVAGKASYSVSTKVEHWFLIVGKYGWETHQWLGTMVAGTSELLLRRTVSREWFFRVANCCFFTILKNSILPYLELPVFFLVQHTTISICGRCFLFWRLSTSYSNILLFGVICSQKPLNNRTLAPMLQENPNYYAQI